MSLPFLSTPPSCPCHFLGVSASFSTHVPFFRCESVPCISRRADWLPCPLFPFHSPCTPVVFISVPFMSRSPLFPFHFPLLSCHVDFLFAPLISLHFLEFPLCSPAFPTKKTRFSQRFRKEDAQKHRVFQIAGRGIRAWDPCLTPAPRRLRLVAARYVSDVGEGGGGGYPLSSLRCPTRRAMSADMGRLGSRHNRAL